MTPTELEDMQTDRALFSIKVCRLREDAERIASNLTGEEAKTFESIEGELSWVQGKLGEMKGEDDDEWHSP